MDNAADPSCGHTQAPKPKSRIVFHRSKGAFAPLSFQPCFGATAKLFSTTYLHEEVCLCWRSYHAEKRKEGEKYQRSAAIFWGASYYEMVNVRRLVFLKAQEKKARKTKNDMHKWILTTNQIERQGDYTGRGASCNWCACACVGVEI